MSSNTPGQRGHHHASLLRELHRHLDPVPGHDVGPMLKSAESMLMDLASRHAGTPLADLVEQIRPFILQMQDSIRAAHSSAQQTLNNFADDFSGCNTAKDNGEREATSLENTKNGHSDDHKACRTLQRSAHDQWSACESTLATLQDAVDSSCQLYESAQRTPGCSGIPPNPGETWRSYVIRAATWFATERDSFLHKEEVCNNDTARLQAQRTTCLGSDGSSGQRQTWEDKVQECDGIQNHLESATCSYVSKVDDTCESFASCTNSNLVILRLRQLNHQFCHLVINIHLFEDGGTVIGDGDVSIRGDHQLVQTLGPKTGLEDLTDGLGSDDVGLDGLGSRHPVHLVLILQDQEGTSKLIKCKRSNRHASHVG